MARLRRIVAWLGTDAPEASLVEALAAMNGWRRPLPGVLRAQEREGQRTYQV